MMIWSYVREFFFVYELNTDLSASVSNTDFTARETFLWELTSEEFDEFSLENTV